MLPVNFDAEETEKWFASEAAKALVAFAVQLGKIQDEVASEIEAIRQTDLGETFIERMERDIKAAGFDRIEQAIVDVL